MADVGYLKSALSLLSSPHPQKTNKQKNTTYGSPVQKRENRDEDSKVYPTAAHGTVLDRRLLSTYGSRQPGE